MGLLLTCATLSLGSSATKTVGTSDPNYDYPTIAAAFAAVNAGSITDGNGNPADSVTLVLMDAEYTESELVLTPPNGQPRAVVITPNDTTTYATINISQNLGMLVALRVDSLASFTISYVNIVLDTAYTWEAAIEVSQAKEWVKPCPSHIVAPTASIGIKVNADSSGTIIIQNSTISCGKKGTNMLLPAICSELHIKISNTLFSSADTAIFIQGSCATTINISGNTFDSVGSAIVLDSVGADSITVTGNTATFGSHQNAQLEIQQGQDHGQMIVTENAATMGKDQFAHFKDHRGQGHDNIIVITNNTLTAVDSADAGVLLEGLQGDHVRIESNTIDMGGSGTAIDARKHRRFRLDNGLDVLVVSDNSISNAMNGVAVALDNDTTGLGGIDPDSLTFGSFDISYNTLSDVKGGFRVYVTQYLEPAPLLPAGTMIISNNTLTGSTDPNNLGLVGIWLDSIAADTVEINSNTIENFVTGGWITKWEGPDLEAMYIIGNTISHSVDDGLHLTVLNYSDDTANVVIENNTFSNNGGDGLEIIVEGDSGLVVVNAVSNTFSNNGGNGVAYRGRGGQYSQFKDHRGQGHDNIIVPIATPDGSSPFMLASGDPPNSFVSNMNVGLVLDGNVDAPDGIHFQNFASNGNYNFFNGTNQNIDAKSNWWGTTDSATIADKILDGNDSSGLGVTSFVPFLLDSVSSSITQVEMNLLDGWNLLSVPVVPSDYAKTEIFPGATSEAFAYAGMYQAKQVLERGVGYWVKFNGIQSQTMTGLELTSDTIDVLVGWNMIGSISTPIAVSQITSIPGGIVTTQFFKYTTNYSTADSIHPGKGYWVKVNSNGKLVLTSSSIVPSSAGKITIEKTDELPPPPPNGVLDKRNKIPSAYALKQNYPNPFNPMTFISLDLPVLSVVSLKVYNMLGQEAATLLNEKAMDGGSYQLSFDASSLASGVYFYRVEAKRINATNENVAGKIFTSMKKMILMK